MKIGFQNNCIFVLFYSKKKPWIEFGFDLLEKKLYIEKEED